MFAAVSVTWNGTTLTGPTLIYLDEILLDGTNNRKLKVGDPNRPGALVCRSETLPQTFWRNALGNVVYQVPIAVGYIQQISNAQRLPNLCRLSRGTEETESFTNGLFTCGLNAWRRNLEEVIAIHVGVYIRGERAS